jgi:ATP dependent DNA ligase domain
MVTVSKRKARLATSARLPAFVEPMQAKLVESLPSGDWIYEIKFDGYRALALRGGRETQVLSPNEKDLGRKFTEVTDSVGALDVRDAIIDGEIVALDEKGRSYTLAIAEDDWRDPSEWTGLNCSSASFGWFFLLGFLVVLSIKSGQQTGVQTYP